MSGKQYGLILPNKNKDAIISLKTRALNPLRDSDDELERDEDKESSPINWVEESLKKSAGNSGQKSLQKRLLKEALNEDATVFQYDEVYDDIKASQTAEKQKQTMQKKPKYIESILRNTEKRKLDNERRVERKVQKERDAEGDKFKDKESFVTPSYMKKLEEMKNAERQEKLQQMMDEKDDVTKHKNMGLFYNHLYKQRLGSDGIVKEEPSGDSLSHSKNGSNESVISKPCRHRERNYRRQDSGSEDESKQKNEEQNSLRIKTEPTSDESDIENEISHSYSSKSSSRKEGNSRTGAEFTHSSKRRNSPSRSDRNRERDRSKYRTDNYGRRDRSRSRDRSRAYERRDRDRSVSPRREHYRDDRRHSTEKSGSKEAKSRKGGERYGSREKRCSESKSNGKQNSNKDSDELRSKEDQNIQHNSETKTKKNISNTLGATNVNKMKLDERIERFQKLFTKRTVGDRYNEAVRNYFARKANLGSKGLV